MDPLGLALENFNALGRWRDTERAAPVDASGTLITGEPFKDVRELKRILVERHRREFYRCLTEKLLTYALARGVEHHDRPAIRQILRDAKPGGYTWSSLILGIVQSTPFQMRRVSAS
jgi:hypothetical protein